MRRNAVHIVIWMLLFQGCSYGIGDDFVPEEERVPIRMAIKEEKLPTRAPVTVINSSNVSSVGIYGVREGTTAGQFLWTASPFASNIVPSGISGNQLTFTPSLYYPLGGKRVLFYGYYPRTTATSGANYVTAPGVGTAPTYHFTLTGAEDVMYAVSAPSGSADASPQVALTFNHTLTQLILNVSLLGSLSSIKLVGVNTQGTLDIGTGNVTYNSTVGDFVLTVPLLSSVTNPVMVPAGMASYKVEVVLLLSLLKRTYLIKPTSGVFQAGMIYTITL